MKAFFVSDGVSPMAPQTALTSNVRLSQLPTYSNLLTVNEGQPAGLVKTKEGKEWAPRAAPGQKKAPAKGVATSVGILAGPLLSYISKFFKPPYPQR